uniref:Uncharacterized protein n=1 Tax=Pithovirus LCPAC406 TaxID=2506599 RepID=A0A481ZEF1_9VIRU|nr:MAG: uncharacterized protein LCPAC406_00990 [Pithovirus LCPAC406]
MKTLKDLSFKLVSDDNQYSTGLLIDAKKGFIMGSILSDIITVYSSKTPYKPYKASIRCKCPNMKLAIYLIDTDVFKNTPKTGWKRSFLLEEGFTLFAGGFEKDDKMISVMKTTIVSFPKSKLLIDTDINQSYQIILSCNYGKEMIGSPIIDGDGDTVGILGEYGMISIGTVISIYKYMDNSNLDNVEYPTPALMWSYGIRSIMRYKTNNENTYGILVKNVLSDSYLNDIHSEDIITHIVFGDNVAFLDRYGYSNIVKVAKSRKLYTHNYGDFKLVSNRRVSLEELFELIEGNFSIQIIRDFKPIMIKCKVEKKSSKLFGYEILTYQDYIFREPTLFELSRRKQSEWYENRLIVDDDWIVMSMRELRNQIKDMDDRLVIKTESSNLIVLWKDT